MNNQYFILRHGETIHQTKKKNMTYPWPEKSPIKLTKRGQKQIREKAKRLKKRKIDLIYSSDVFRTRQAAEIVAKELGLKVIFDKRLWDINLGIYQDRPKKEFYQDFPNPKERFYKKPEKGESWSDVKKRIISFIKEIEKKHRDKTILIVSHGDPLWLLEGAVKGMTNQELLDEIFVKKNYINTAELRKLE